MSPLSSLEESQPHLHSSIPSLSSEHSVERTQVGVGVRTEPTSRDHRSQEIAPLSSQPSVGQFEVLPSSLEIAAPQSSSTRHRPHLSLSSTETEENFPSSSHYHSPSRTSHRRSSPYHSRRSNQEYRGGSSRITTQEAIDNLRTLYSELYTRLGTLEHLVNQLATPASPPTYSSRRSNSSSHSHSSCTRTSPTFPPPIQRTAGPISPLQRETRNPDNHYSVQVVHHIYLGQSKIYTNTIPASSIRVYYRPHSDLIHRIDVREQVQDRTSSQPSGSRRRNH